jgi:hypothetical protein
LGNIHEVPRPPSTRPPRFVRTGEGSGILGFRAVNDRSLVDIGRPSGGRAVAGSVQIRGDAKADSRVGHDRTPQRFGELPYSRCHSINDCPVNSSPSGIPANFLQIRPEIADMSIDLLTGGCIESRIVEDVLGAIPPLCNGDLSYVDS